MLKSKINELTGTNQELIEKIQIRNQDEYNH